MAAEKQPTEGALLETGRCESQLCSLAALPKWWLADYLVYVASSLCLAGLLSCSHKGTEALFTALDLPSEIKIEDP